ncbi:unnamed protein product [Euphydryas editha]|uniref:Uncharacterized protein n=1 Tax=Euphydryas editha TaxID=104508 RepID=A0AAU9TS35_EUPED|nr:unnamed protein product [Euphydryas editha]
MVHVDALSRCPVDRPGIDQHVIDILTINTLCEVKAAAELFSYQFQVYQDGCLRATFGEASDVIKRLRFTGNHNNGHYDVLVPLFEPISIDITQPSNNLCFKILIKNQNLETETEDVTNLSSSQLTSDTTLLSSDGSAFVTEISIRSKNGTKRRKRFSSAIRAKQLKKAASKYTKNHREVHREAARKYNESHPEILKQATQTYRQTHPDVVKKIQKAYNEKNPHVNRVATAKYHEKKIKI